MSSFCDAEGWAVFSTSRAMDFSLCFQNRYVYFLWTRGYDPTQKKHEKTKCLHAHHYLDFSHPIAHQFCYYLHLITSVVTLIPSVFIMIFISPRLLTVIGKGRLDGVKVNPVFVLKMVTVIAAFAAHLGILIKLISDSDLYGSSSVLSTVVYLVGLVCIPLLFLS